MSVTSVAPEKNADPRALMYRRLAEMQDRGAKLGRAVREAAEAVVENIGHSETHVVHRADLEALRNALEAEKQHYAEVFGPDDYKGARP